jgi:hypothetical protein
MTRALIKSSKTKENMYKKSIGKPKNSQCYLKFIQYRNIYNKTKRVCKQQYYKDELSLHQNDPRRLWKLLNQVIGRTKSTKTISEEFIVDNKLINNRTEICEQFCKYFSEIGQKYASKIPTSKKTFVEYLTANSPADSL